MREKRIIVCCMAIALLLAAGCKSASDSGTPTVSPTAMAGITASAGTLAPAFSEKTTSYTLSVANSVETVTMTGTPKNAASTVAYTPSRQIALTVGVPATAKLQVVSASGAAGTEYTVVITRQAQLVTHLEMNVSAAELLPTETIQLTVAATPANATNKAVTWSSSDTGVAGVADGLVTAVSGGTAVITATAADGSGETAACTVTVSDIDTGAGITVTFTAMTDEPPTMEKNTNRSISQARNQSLTVKATGYDSYSWIVDADQYNYYENVALGEIRVYAQNYSYGQHSVLAIVYKNGLPYSREVIFTVAP
ncbi:Ig-like domain-containing protein [Brucepastera parasyntrophica]|uniref:Ig-like domain-containing protein n=1 Tax=Brucepastera parasyntrophica TaxID=2880008 RepID=UPI002109556E|nr:Ig-like domain-containing protein [Brucepastera parasyntrophica]ULQ59679.1 Ig-like domain-containing protein [Brucepastera parasyntrophica]